jgi:hypothetical protein
VTANAEKLRGHLEARGGKFPDQTAHIGQLTERADSIRSQATALRGRSTSMADTPADVAREADALLEQTVLLKQQTPKTLFRLRLFEIGLPLVLSVVSLLLTLRYPLTEERCYEIKEALKERHAARTIPP